MGDSNEELRVVPELYFLIAKFLSGGPLKETAQTLLKELERVEVLPRRLDWEGNEHTQSYRELASQYSDVSWRRLASVCERALSLAQVAPSLSLTAPGSSGTPGQLQLTARLSLLSESLVRPPPKYASYKQDHSLVRRLWSRSLGSGPGSLLSSSVFPARLLSGVGLQRRTLGHLSAVYCLVFDCTGRYVITGADDLLVKVWSAVDGRLLATLRGAGAEITDVCVSADGALVACGSVERLVRVWCLATGAPRAVLHAHQGTITSVHWAPPARTDVRWLASTSTDGSVAFWTCSPDGQFLSQPVQYVERMRPGACHMICAAWSAGGALLAAGSADHHVRLYTVEHEPGGPRRVLEKAVHGDAVDSIAWAHRGLRFVSGSKDGSAALWTLHATQWRHVLLLPTDHQPSDAKRLKVTMVCWDCSDAFVVTAVSDNTVRVWDAQTCQQVRSLAGHRDEAYVLEAHPFLSAVILSAGHDGQLFVWDVASGEVLCQFHNHIDGQGDGAIFDAKWGGGASIAASDSHGHLLLLGLGEGHRLLRKLPTELFFHTDYRPLVRDALGGALDEQTEVPPHLMAPPFLVDVEGAPHAPHHQRRVPGRENLALSQLIPAADAADAARARDRLDLMIEALAAARSPPHRDRDRDRDRDEPARGVWRGEGVRHTAGSWQSGDPQLVPASTRAIVPPLAPSVRLAIEQASGELNAMEQSWYRREMRRRPLMISTALEAGPRRRPGRRPNHAARPPPRPRPRPHTQVVEEPPDSLSSLSESSESSLSVRLSRHSSRARSDRGSSLDLDLDMDLTTDDTSHSGSKSDESASSQYSDWEAGAALAPPARARRRPLPTNRYSPSVTPSKRPERATTSAAAAAAAAAASSASASATPSSPQEAGSAAAAELPEVYRPGEWLTAVSPRKAPYHPQMGDECLYFRLGHQRYFEAVSEKDLYKVNPRDKPWERSHVYECEMVKVVGIKYVIKPPRVVCLRLACTGPGPGTGTGTGTGTGPGTVGEGGGSSRCLTVRYHDMADVIDFLVLRQQYECATARHWGQGDRFRCMIDDSWWTGVVLERVGPAPGAGGAAPGAEGAAQSEAERWASAAAAHFLSLRVRWDNGEVERLSPWDLEPLDPERLPPEPGGCVPVLSHELEAALYRAEPGEWGSQGDRALACQQIAQHISQVMTLSVAEPFVAPVDLQLYPLYARIVPYPIDLATIRARFDNQWYRRTAAAQFDVRYLATNAEHFNKPHSPIVRQARLITDLLLHIISHWRDVDVVSKYHELAAAYHSSDDEPLAPVSKSRRGRGAGSGSRAAGGTGARKAAARSSWKEACEEVVRDLMSSHDAEPFRQPVSSDQAPDYQAVVPRPMDLGTVRTRLSGGHYSRPEQVAADVRLVFANSRLYNTNKRSRIYSMTVRLSALFETLWSRVPTTSATSATSASPRRRHTRARHATTGRPTRRTRRLARTETQNGVASPVSAVPAGEKCGASPAPSQSPVSPVSSVSSESDGETLAATSRRVHRRRGDSSDSDAPLYKSRKGKGVGKKSKSSSASAEPAAGPSRLAQHETMSERQGSGSEEWCSLEVVEEELPEELVELSYEDGPTQHYQGGVTRGRKRVLSGSASGSHSGSGSPSGSSSSSEWRHPKPRRHKHKHKRIRERFSSQSSSSSGSEPDGADGRGREPDARHYESDHSYRPRYSTDDDAPLHLYRQRQEGGHEPGPSTSTSSTRRDRNRNGRCAGAGAGAGVSLRARRPRRYNEESEDDAAAAAAAISKRLHHHNNNNRHLHHHHRRRLHAAQSAVSLGGGHSNTNSHSNPLSNTNSHTSDHNYFNGHAHNNTRTHNGTTGGVSSGSTNSGPATVSISSRGRVRKLTAKARGLLRD